MDIGPSIGLSCERWVRDEHSWEEWSSTLGRKHYLRPDAYVEIGISVDDTPGVAGAFVEIDFPTMDQARLRAKVARHRAYASDGAWWSKHPGCPVLLLLTTSEARDALFIDRRARQAEAEYLGAGGLDSSGRAHRCLRVGRFARGGAVDARVAHVGRGRADYPEKPLGVSGLASLLTNAAYISVVHWSGVTYPGVHEPLVSTETFGRVQELLSARATRGTRERRHHHYLKGLLVCGVCARRLSIQRSKGTYTYFYCLGQKDRRYPTGCREPYVTADAREVEIEDLCQRVQVPVSWANALEEMLADEITTRNAANRSEREALTRRRERTESERRKLLDAYYANAIDVATLRTEQERIAGGMGTIDARLATLDASLEDWQELIGTALRFATNCARIYRRAGDSRRKEFNTAVLEEVLVRDGHVVNVAYQAPFDLLFAMPKFEYEDVAEGGGFEPPGLITQRFSRPSHSSALPSLHGLAFSSQKKNGAGKPMLSCVR